MFQSDETRVNYRFLAVTAFATIFAGLLIFQLHRQRQSSLVYELERSADSFLGEGNYTSAYRSLSSLTKLKPQDQMRKVQLAECADRIAVTATEIKQAIRLNMQALGICLADPQLADQVPAIRWRLLRRHAELGENEETIDQIAELAGPQMDPELQRLYVIAKARLWRDDRSHELNSSVRERLPEWFSSLLLIRPVDLLVSTNSELPGDFEIAAILCDICLGDPAKLEGSFLAGQSEKSLKQRSQQTARQLTENRPDDPFAWLLLYEVILRDDDLEAPREVLDKAIEVAGENAKPLIVAGKLYLSSAMKAEGTESGKSNIEILERSLAALEKAKALGSVDTELYISMGNIFLLKGQPEEAILRWREGKKVCTSQSSLLDFRLVETLLEMNELPRALDALQVMDAGIRSNQRSQDRSNRQFFLRKSRECWAKYHLACGDYQIAAETIRGVLNSSEGLGPAAQAEIHMQLGAIYEQIAQYDRAVAAHKRAIQLMPNELEYRRASAKSLFSAGRFSDCYKQLMLIEPKTSSDWIQICDVILETQRKSDSDAGYWYSFDKGIQEIERLQSLENHASTREWFVELLQLDAKILRATNDSRPMIIEEAANQLWSIVEREKFDHEVVHAAVLRWKAWDHRPYLERITETLSRSESIPQTPIQRAQILSISGNYAAAKSYLDQTLQLQPEDKEARKAKSLIDVMNLPTNEGIAELRKLKQGAWPIARQLAWKKLRRPIAVSQQQQRDPETRKRLFDEWQQEIRPFEELLREYEGPEGTEWRYLRGRRLLAEAFITGQTNDTELQDTVNFLDMKRPEWSETYLLAGMVSERQGNSLKAIRAYNKALVYGNSDIETHERLVGLLYQQGLLAEARMAVDRLGERGFLSRSISAISLRLERDSPDEQLVLAEAGTRARAQDPMAWIWLAEVTELQSRRQTGEARAQAIEKAERCFTKALEVGKKQDLRIPMAKFNFYLATGNRQGQQMVIDQIEQSQDYEPRIRAVAVGQIYETMGNYKEAVESYRKGVAFGGDDLDLQSRVAQLLIRDNRLEEAIACLNDILTKHPEDAGTKRRLAILLANRSFEEDWQRIAQLLSSSSESGNPEDVRLQVILLSQKNSLPNLQKARFLLEGIAEVPGVGTEEDQVELASLYLRMVRLLKNKGNPQNDDSLFFEKQSERLLKTVANVVSPKPEHIYAYADFLISRNRIFDAVEESRRLQAVAPDAFPTALLSARISKLLGNQNAAKQSIFTWIKGRREIEGFAGDMEKLAQYLVQAGQAMLLMDEPEESRKYFEEAYRIDRRAGLKYVRSILSTEDVALRDSAIRFLMDRLQSESSKESALLLTLLIRKGDTDEELIAAAQEQLVEFGLSMQNDRAQLQSFADLWIWRGHESQAIETFRRIIRERPNDVVALNNLAMLLADTKEGAGEALLYVERAIQLIGAKAALMDSKAYVLLRMERFTEAINILTQLQSSYSSPSVRLHLYSALKKTKQTAQANEVLAKIDTKVLRKIPLTQSDQLELEEIEKALAAAR
jgi:tetratricopeptide (TPR) repeat protein